MKTAISLPEPTFRRVEQRARQLGWTRSKFFATAAEHLLEELDRDSEIESINFAVAAVGASDSSAGIAVALGQRTVAAEDW